MACRCGANSTNSCICRSNASVIGIDWIGRDMQAITGARFQQRMMLGDPKDEAWNLTGATVKMDVRVKPTGLALVSLISPSQITIKDEERRVIEFNADILATTPTGVFPYDLIVIGSDGARKCRARGRFTLYPGITT